MDQNESISLEKMEEFIEEIVRIIMDELKKVLEISEI